MCGQQLLAVAANDTMRAERRNKIREAAAARLNNELNVTAKLSEAEEELQVWFLHGHLTNCYLKNVNYSCFYKYLGEDYAAVWCSKEKRTTDKELKTGNC